MSVLTSKIRAVIRTSVQNTDLTFQELRLLLRIMLAKQPYIVNHTIPYVQESVQTTVMSIQRTNRL